MTNDKNQRTCENCLHQKACFDWCRGFGEEAKLCEHFSNKSEWVHLPNKGFATAYYPLGYGDNAKIIEETITVWGITGNKLGVIDEYGDFYEVGVEVFLSKEEAEKALAERRGK